MGRLTRSGWFSLSYSSGNRRGRRNHSTRPEARRLRFEPLEQRTLLAAFSVTNANSDGSGSLRQAVLDANAAPGADSITFHPSLAGATISTVNLLITDDVDIQGPLDGPVILSGPAPSFRNFPDAGGGRILDIAAGASVSISRLSLMNGNVTDPFITGDSFGGAIRNAGTLTVRQSLFYNNGMGLATGGGGAIYNSGSLTVIASSFAANFADWNSSGGAIYNAGTATVTNSTFIDNMAGISGGSIFNATGGTLTVNNSTILKSGGDALSSGFPVFPAGHGGISNLGTMIMNNTIVAYTFIGSDIENSGVLTGSHNLIKDGSGGVPGTITGDPMLEAPVYTQANSSFPALALLPRPGQYGPPFTIPPLPGSPAIDAGNNSAVNAVVDQRGAPRINNGVVDIGAVEVGIAPVSIVVTTLTDENNGSIDPGLGAGTSLREALSLILPEDVTITFAPGLAGTIALDPSLASLRIIGSHDTDLSPRGDVTLVGPGADVITIDGLAQTRILEINPFPLVRDYSGLVSISGLTFARGTTNSSDGGGAIFALSNLTLTDCFFVNNSSEFVPSPSTIINGGGGAIGARANLSVINCTFSNNSAAAQGGAIWNESEMIVKDSTFIGNSALRGGAIWVESYNRFQGPFIRPTVTSSTFSENTATEYGGAIFIGSYRSHLSPAELSVINSTISNNSAGLNGGGIHVAGDLALYGSTVYGNSAASAGPTVAGGIAIVDLPVELNHARLVTLANSIVAGSTSGADLTTFLLLNGTVTGSHNLIGDGSGGLPNTIIGDPLLGPLADNGGPTQTHALLPGSPAIDAGQNVTPQFPTSLSLTLTSFTFPQSEGSLPGNTHFAYRVSAFNALGESPAAEGSIMSGAHNFNWVNLSWDAVPGAWGYNVYGRTEGTEQFIGRVWSYDTQVFQFRDFGLPISDAYNTRTDIDQRGSGFARVIGNGADLGAFELQTAPLAGDYNRNGTVDAADYVLWRKTHGTTGVTPYSGADGTGNGSIEQADNTVWRANFGLTLPIGASGTSNVASQESTAAASAEAASNVGTAPAATTNLAQSSGVEQEPLVTPAATVSASSQRDAAPVTGLDLSWLADAAGSPQIRSEQHIASTLGRVDPLPRNYALLAWYSSYQSNNQLLTENHGSVRRSHEGAREVDGAEHSSVDEIFAELGDVAGIEL